MSRGAKCDHCDALFTPAKGTVTLEYAICAGGNSYTNYSPDDGYSDSFELCPPCSKEFLAFMRHED